MILECLNETCGVPLVYLRGGRIVRTEYRSGANLKLEHFWLCGDCSPFYSFRIFPDRPAIAVHGKQVSQRYVTSEQACVMKKYAVGHNRTPPLLAKLREWDSNLLLRRSEPTVPVQGHLQSQ